MVPFSFISYLIAIISPEITCLWHLDPYQRSSNRHMCMYTILILVRKVQNKAIYICTEKLNGFLWKYNEKNVSQYIAIQCKNIAIYRNTFFLYRDIPINHLYGNVVLEMFCKQEQHAWIFHTNTSIFLNLDLFTAECPTSFCKNGAKCTVTTKGIPSCT